ncbi:HNH endonuclease signature motif containing protein [Streptomyces sp. NPDC001422]|uniref:HNH endonuclease signature motif containing protein n=1 Tax=Streptomyces sp. NPDC001422 TaxID=3364575 RepID=UPI0036B0AC46
MKTCSQDGCDLPAYSRGTCRKHYDHLRRAAKMPLLPKVNVGQPCSVSDCATEAKKRGMCGLHYQRFCKTGDPLGFRTPPVEARFWSKVNRRTPQHCWEWTGYRMRDGYGQFSYGGNRVGRAHVFSYELHHGPVASGLNVLHSCDNPPCVNPAHLSAGTQAENMWQMVERHRRKRKLTDAQMIEIRDSPDTQKVLSHRYGISQGYVSMIKRQYREGMHRSFTS